MYIQFEKFWCQKNGKGSKSTFAVPITTRYNVESNLSIWNAAQKPTYPLIHSPCPRSPLDQTHTHTHIPPVGNCPVPLYPLRHMLNVHTRALKAVYFHGNIPGSEWDVDLTEVNPQLTIIHSIKIRTNLISLPLLHLQGKTKLCCCMRHKF